ncbi:putative disease resistance RPP13-like protein 1 [Telopea speciosissima]|uniref:putative disease resistance RPP13-like protein 1 n=1 Tax=Telopea speciosissima TaxID=54955 RepID=UPI001CC74162|nr:putative disease resistance RPP13-like protein 1 [Telopea speciosissima]
MIQALSDEAEVKQFTNVAVKLWLGQLKQLLYDAEDILDEYATELLRLKLESAHRIQQEIKRIESEGRYTCESLQRMELESEYQTQPHQTQQVRNPVPLAQGEISISSLLESGNISEIKGINEWFGSKLRDINERLKSVAQEGVTLGLNLSTSNQRVQRPPTSSLVISSKVFGREQDMWKIVKWLLSNKTPSLGDHDNNFSVLPIVGMGGIGKTTLAQLVYNHETVKKHFGVKAWVCVSEDFDVVKLTKGILESATGSSPNFDSLDLLQEKLKEALSNKRFLLVLDDMWNENYERWDALSTAFAFGKPGSKILVTTRNKGVASMVRTDLNDHDHDLKGLSDEACLALVRRHAFMNGNSSDDVNEKLEIFGQDILKKCKGLPLAVKTLAGILRDKREKSEWKDILENEIWDVEGSTEILPSLVLSYHHLPPHLKRCFAYCALFPKDYEFDKIELVRLWMAEGIVQPKGTKRLEDIGVGYFDDLFMRSFFDLSNRTSDNPYKPCSIWRRYDELSSEDELRLNRVFYWNIERHDDEHFYDDLSECLAIKSFSELSNNISGSSKLFVMHDLIHDLAHFVSGEIYCRREDDKPAKILTATRHLSLIGILSDVTEEEATYVDIDASKDVKVRKFRDVKENKSLRTLLMDGPRYLDMSFITTTLQFLRVLRWTCSNKFNGPMAHSIGNLKHLRLLDLSKSDIGTLPDSIGSLYNLQTLNLTKCHHLRELPKDMGDLVNLRHLFLPLSFFRRMPLRCGSLTNLQTLSLFCVGSDTGDCSGIEELRDLSQLRGKLEIAQLENVGHNWTKAMEAHLKNKPHLRELQLSWTSRYNRIKDFFLGSQDEKAEEHVFDQLQPHTNLEMLRIVNYGGTRFPSWVGHPSFSNLVGVKLIGCDKCIFLPSLGQLPSLKYLMIDSCNAVKSAGCELYGDNSSVNKQFRSLETLVIHNMIELEEWTEVVKEEQGGEEFPCLHKLVIRDCPKLTWFSHRFSRLVTLVIENCSELQKLPHLLPSLQELRIAKCEKLAILPNLPSIQRLALLALLALEECHQMTTLCDSQRPSSSSSSSSSPHVCNSNVEEYGEGKFRCLHELYIFHCPNMIKLPHTLPSLVKLRIEACEKLTFLPILPSIKRLGLEQCNGMVLESLGLHNLTSLSYLYIGGCPALVSIPKGLLPTNLRGFFIDNCPILESLHDGLSDLTSLKWLHIGRMTDVKSMSE